MNLQFYLPISWEKKQNSWRSSPETLRGINTFDEDIVNNPWLNLLFKTCIYLKQYEYVLSDCPLRVYDTIRVQEFQSILLPRTILIKKNFFKQKTKNLIWWYLKNTLNTKFSPNIAINLRTPPALLKHFFLTKCGYWNWIEIPWMWKYQQFSAVKKN